MATARQRGTKQRPTWLVQAHVDIKQPDGQLKRSWVTETVQEKHTPKNQKPPRKVRDAMKRVDDEADRRKTRNAELTNDPETLNELIDYFISVRPTRWMESTKETNLNRIKHIKKAPFVHKPLHSISARHIQQWLNREAISGEFTRAKTKRIISMISQIYKFGLNQQLVLYNPAIALSNEAPHPPKSKREWPSNEQAKQVWSYKYDDPYYASIMRMMISSGCRRAEICALQWSDYDFETGVMTIQRTVTMNTQISDYVKNKRDRKILLPDNMRQEMKTWHSITLDTFGEEPKYIWWYRGNHSIHTDKHCRPGTLYEIWNRTARILEIRNISPHGWRHFMGSTLIANGVDVATVAEHLGDSIDVVINTYVHPMSHKQSVVAETLDDIFDNEE